MKKKLFNSKKDDQSKKTEDNKRPTLKELEEFFQPEDHTTLKEITYTFIATKRKE